MVDTGHDAGSPCGTGWTVRSTRLNAWNDPLTTTALALEAEAERAQLEAVRPEVEPQRSIHATRLFRARNVITRYEAQKTNPSFSMELHVLRLGEVAFATNPFELFLDYGLRIKARSRALQNFLIQLACARGTYLPTRRAIQGKHYGAGAADNLVGPEGGQVLVDRTVDLISGMWGEDRTR